LDNFIESNSYFSLSSEEITSLYHAIKQPECFRNVFEALGLSESKYKIIEEKSINLAKEEKDEIIASLFVILLDLDSTPELPEILPKTNLEALISPRDPGGNSIGNITNFKNIYEDPRKDPRYKYQSSPFKKPKNDIERSFDEFLNKIKENPYEKKKLRELKNPVTQSLPKLKSINKAFHTQFLSPTSTVIQTDSYDHERALKNWSKLKTILQMSILTSSGLKG
jgi:hypothetical protein